MILNFAEATGGKGTIVVGATPDPTSRVSLRVDADGPGIPPSHQRAVLRPSFTTTASGTGIGMLSVVACARDHGGEVSISESPHGGARVELTLRPASHAA